MSALARYFALTGSTVSGYDRTPTPLTDSLAREGMHIHFTEDVAQIPPDVDLVVLTPAIPSDHQELAWFKSHGIPVLKRSEVLGKICAGYRTIAVAGTHGKTTTSTLISHILTTAGIPHIAFLGGISKNYGTNFICTDGKPSSRHFCVVEADEYDRSFLHLAPDIAIITSTDADHLDIYHDHASLVDSFSRFTGCIRKNGTLVLKAGTRIRPVPSGIRVFSYALEAPADFFTREIRIEQGQFHFSLITPEEALEGFVSGHPGRFNVENAVAASAACQVAGITLEHVREAIATYQGVRRRFDFHMDDADMIFIDDYAHHPEEIRACITAVRELYPDRKITGVFQPHLYSRTRDFAEGFAESLSLLDTLFLLPIYPARELPVEGVTSDLIFSKARIKDKHLVTKEDLISQLLSVRPQVLITLGAGDIDQLVEPVISAFRPCP